MRMIRLTARTTEEDYVARFAGMSGVPPTGRTLRSYIERFGGLEGNIDDPLGDWQQISLEAFRDIAPERFLELAFYFPPEGEGFPPLGLGEVVLKEYPLPEGAEIPLAG